jgi:hypothetical protein
LRLLFRFVTIFVRVRRRWQIVQFLCVIEVGDAQYAFRLGSCRSVQIFGGKFRCGLSGRYLGWGHSLEGFTQRVEQVDDFRVDRRTYAEILEIGR